MKHLKTFENIKICQRDLKKFFVCKNGASITIFQYNRSDQNNVAVIRLYSYYKGVKEKESTYFFVNFEYSLAEYILYTSDDLNDCLYFVDMLGDIKKYNL